MPEIDDSQTSTLKPQRRFDALFEYCRREGWKGWDPYDGLNIGRALGLKVPIPGKWPRIALIQACKRSPINFRPLLGIPKHANPKGHALAVRALVARAECAEAQGESGGRFDAEAVRLIGELGPMRATMATGAAWGYPFDWQSRAFFAPRGLPSVVCTTFVAQAHLDVFERLGASGCLETARSACDFVLEDLARTPDPEDRKAFCFSYTPLDRAQVHNASLLGAALLARVFSITGEKNLRAAALSAVRYSLRRQRADGSWPYGEAPNQQWIDSFHTGFNLVCLDEIARYLDFQPAKEAMERGFTFFLQNFFLSDGRPKYYHDGLYPIDIHSSAQALVTLTRLGHLNPDSKTHLRACLSWTLQNMRSPDGSFYFQWTPRFINRISYMRWSQTWMLFGLSAVLKAEAGLDVHLIRRFQGISL